MTTADGSYDFTGLPAGAFEVAVTGALPPNVTNSFDPDVAGPGDGVASIALGIGEDNDDQDFGYAATSVLGDRVWFDVDRDGVQDPGENGINGVEVTATFLGIDGVLGGGDDVVFTTVTSGDGDYLFQNVPDGAYVVEVTSGVPAGLDATFDEDSGTGGPDEITDVALAAEHLTADFGYAGTSGLGDTVWFDRNADGVQDANEIGLAGVDVIVTWHGPDGVGGGGDDLVASATTAADGSYFVSNLPAGEYTVAVDLATLPSGFAETYDLDSGTTGPDATTAVTLAMGEIIDTVDFGFNGSGSIGDTVWYDRNGDGTQDADEVGIAGVTIDVIWQGPTGPVTFTAVTDVDGSYAIDGLPPGDYAITVDTATLPGSMTATADSDGAFDSMSAITLADGEDNDDQDFGYTAAASIGDVVYLDVDGDGTQGPDEPGVAGQPITLTWASPSGPITFTAVTDADGMYVFDNLPDGAYTVAIDGGVADLATNTADPDGGADSTSAVTISGGVDDLGQDFGYQGANSLGDQVWFDADANGLFDGGEPGLAGVTIEVVWFGPDGAQGGGDDVVLPTVTTDAAGTYGLSGLPDGSFSVGVASGVPVGADTPTYDGDSLGAEPDGLSIVAELGVGDPAPAADLGQDFGFTGSSSVGDNIWIDLNGDGVVDVDEPPVPGVTVTVTSGGLDGTLGTPDDIVVVTVTDGTGSYVVEHLPPGPVEIVVTDLPGGLEPTADPDGGAPDHAALVLGIDETNVDQDFGYVGSASVGDLVWLDADGDGAADPGEPGVAGVPITVVHGGADGVIGTADDIVFSTVSDAGGMYLVEGLPAGPLVVGYDAADLDPGLAPSSDLDAGDPASSAAVIAVGDAPRDVDFAVVGGAALDGDVWIDLDGDGARDADEEGIADVTVIVTFDGPDGPIVISVVTGPDGGWELPSVPAGDYRVEVDPATLPENLVPTTVATADVTVPAGGAGTAVHGFASPASLGDRIWDDRDRDGIADDGEPPLAGVTVTLLDGDGTTVAVAVTDSDGGYLFDGLAPGPYVVVIDPTTLPDGYVVTGDPDDDLDGETAVVVRGGETRVDIDFGAAAPPATSGGLPATGSTTSVWLLLAAVLLVAGIVLRVGSRAAAPRHAR